MDLTEIIQQQISSTQYSQFYDFVSSNGSTFEEIGQTENVIRPVLSWFVNDKLSSYQNPLHTDRVQMCDMFHIEL